MRCIKIISVAIYFLTYAATVHAADFDSRVLMHQGAGNDRIEYQAPDGTKRRAALTDADDKGILNIQNPEFVVENPTDQTRQADHILYKAPNGESINVAIKCQRRNSVSDERAFLVCDFEVRHIGGEVQPSEHIVEMCSWDGKPFQLSLEPVENDPSKATPRWPGKPKATVNFRPGSC
jgi:hypothetical protein